VSAYPNISYVNQEKACAEYTVLGDLSSKTPTTLLESSTNSIFICFQWLFPDTHELELFQATGKKGFGEESRYVFSEGTQPTIKACVTVFSAEAKNDFFFFS
jgi:hypothetical protein